MDFWHTLDFMQTVRAEIDENGAIRLLDRVIPSSRRRALVVILDDEPTIAETALLSEAALAEDWNRPEEDAVWSRLESAQ